MAENNAKVEAVWFPESRPKIEAGNNSSVKESDPRSSVAGAEQSTSIEVGLPVKGEATTGDDSSEKKVNECEDIQGGTVSEKDTVNNSEANSASLLGHLSATPEKPGQVFKCHICHKEVKYHRVAKRSSVAPLDDKTHECDICLQRFKEKSSLVLHYFVHLKDGLYECLTCQEHFYTRGLLKRHSATHLRDQHFVCDTCRLKLGYRNNFLTHLSHHSNDCLLCRARFRQSSHLKVHMLTHHNRSWQRPEEEMEKKELCNVCNTLVSRSWLKFHMFKHEIKEKTLT